MQKVFVPMKLPLLFRVKQQNRFFSTCKHGFVEKIGKFCYSESHCCSFLKKNQKKLRKNLEDSEKVRTFASHLRNEALMKAEMQIKSFWKCTGV